MSEFVSGVITGAFAMLGLFIALFGMSACVVGARADKAMRNFEPYDPENKL